jgi:hypothetical protein
MKHDFRPAHTPLLESRRWRCKCCGLSRRRVVATNAGVPPFSAMPLRSFWIYRLRGGAAWQTGYFACTRLR